MIGIRVDTNREIATGHVMRCLSIAFGMKTRGIDCVFITADEYAKQIVSSNGFEVVCLNSQWNEFDNELENLIKLLQEYKIAKLIIDSYYVTEQYLGRLAYKTKVIYIDDMNFFRYPVSMVINYNVYYDIFRYPEIYSGTKTQLLLGCDYAPLREEFKSIQPLFRGNVKKVLITSGGTDQFNVAGKLLSKVVRDKLFEGIKFHVVVGRMNTHLDFLKKLSDRSNRIELHQNVKAMSELMRYCDIAITAGGSTMYELCACGVPSICFSFADNQLYGVKGFERELLMTYAGDVRDDENQCISNLIASIEDYIADSNLRKEKAINMRKKVDGNGVNRIVKAIVDL